jgi:aminopeptidase N
MGKIFINFDSMRKQLLILLLNFFFITSGAQPIDVLHYRYEINLNDNNDTITGKATITFIALAETKSVAFDLTDLDKKGKGMQIIKVSLPYKNPYSTDFGNMPVHLNESIIIYAWAPLPKGDTFNVTIDYKGIPDDGLIISKNKYGDRTFFSDNWPDRAHHWIPCIDRPDDKASFEFFVTAPSHYSVISNGTKIEEKETGNDKKLTHWKEDIPLSTKVMVIGVAKFAVKTFADSPENIPVSAWVYQQDSLPGFRNYSVAPAILKFLTAYIGPYPYEKLANVQSKTIFGGMENASAIFYEETSASLFQNIESLLAHEIVHQWFGDMASEKSFPHLWLSEGFATYLTHIYIESKYGTDSLNNEMKRDRDQIISFVKESHQPVVDSVSPLMNLLNANSYQKGGWILHMLRRQLGDDVFRKIIRNYYSAYAGKNADTRDFQKICEKESGKDLSTFFDQWLYSSAFPKLEVQWSYDEKNKMVLLKVNQLQNKAFQFPLDVKIQLASGKMQLEIVDITKQTQQFSLPVKEKPLQLSLDPDTSLLFEGSARMSK